MRHIITIGREFGSGGREVGQKLAERLNVPFYDKELISMAAKECDFSEAVLEAQEERPPKYFLESVYSVYMMPMSDKIFLAQSKVIQKLAEKPCIIVGRCADYILEHRDTINLFITAPLEERLTRKKALDLGLAPDKLRKHIQNIDKNRAKYYNTYTDRNWGAVDNYDLCINSAQVGIDGCVNVIAAYVEQAER